VADEHDSQEGQGQKVEATPPTEAAPKIGQTADSDAAVSDAVDISDSATIQAPGGVNPEMPAGATPVVRSNQSLGDVRQPATLVGQSLAGRYTVLEMIGKGGMSVVYRARHELLKKVVAIKVLREALATNQESLTRFHREAMAAASIGDAHIVDITDYGFTERGDAFIVMEALEGHNLREIIAAEGALETGRCVAITRQILRALTAAHAQGIIHRDLKAENVFVTRREGRDFIKLLDFGISKVLQPAEGEDATGLTSTGQVMGTPQYLAPEQAQGIGDVDHRVDIYALGVMLYEMLTGELPFSGTSVFDLVMKHVQEPPQPPSERRKDLTIPPTLEQVTLQALAKKPEERFPSAEAMLAALPDSDALPGGFPSGTLTDGIPMAADSARQRKARKGAVTMLLFGVALLVAGGLLIKRYVAGPVADGADAGAVAGDAGSQRPEDAGSQRPDRGRPDLSAAKDAVTVQITITVRPKQAKVYLDGELLGRGDQKRDLPRSGREHTIRVVAVGHLTRRFALKADQSRVKSIVLSRSGAGTKKKTGNQSDLDQNPYNK
jgi:tRNA A-37 threonylcarbamoyl transferase component Bud32